MHPFQYLRFVFSLLSIPLCSRSTSRSCKECLLSLMICHTSSATSSPPFTNSSPTSSGCILSINKSSPYPVVPHVCPFAIAFSRPFLCLREKSFVRIHLYLLVIIHAHVLVAVILFSGAFLVECLLDTRVLPCYVVHFSLPEMGREVLGFCNAPHALYSSDITGPAGVPMLS